MKSRVERYKSLHEKIDQSVDAKVESSGLSEFANRLNEIDNQFEPMHVKEIVPPKRAKETELEIFDTFENEYLKDFLDEVKAYNVEKGYRSTSSTRQNILKELNILESDESENGIIEPIDHVEVEMEPETETSFWENYISNLEVESEDEATVEALDLNNQIDEDFDEESHEELADDLDEEDVILKDEAITQEILELAAAIDGEEVSLKETIPLDDYDAPIEDKKEEAFSMNEIESESSHVENSLDDVEEYSEHEVRKYRYVNALVSVALMGAVLAAAIAIKYLVLN